jgi:uncharacterized membrane protein
MMNMKKRLPFIDFARGLVMILMAWDHASYFWNPLRRANEGLMGMRPAFPNLGQFLLRFITHYAAPTFVFLAGTALALSTARRLERGESQASISLHLIIRGVVLLLFELVLVSTAFELPHLYFGVIACIGLSLILFSLIRRLPPVIILIASAALIVAAPLLSFDWIPYGANAPGWHYLRVILAEARWDLEPYVGLYPLIPWIGVMGIGWWFGVFLGRRDEASIKRLALPLLLAGLTLIGLWFVVRLVNGYGNLLPRKGTTLEGWLYMSKYPPSLAFLLWSLGGMCLFLALGIVLQDRPGFTKGVMGVVIDFGQVPLFFYLVHLWLYRLSFLLLSGVIKRGTVTALAIYVIGLGLLWALCVQYGRLKGQHPRSVLQYV